MKAITSSVRLFVFLVAVAALALSGPPAAHADVTVPPHTITIDDVTKDEGNSGTSTFTFTVRLTNPPSGMFTLMVNYATSNGTAAGGTACSTMGVDYLSRTGNVTFNRNNLTRPIDITVCGDTTFEPDETFFVDLSNATHNAVIAKSRGTGTIRNDDAAPLRSTSTSVTCVPASFEAGATTSCTATVTDTDAGVKSPPMGTVSFTSDGPGTFAPTICVLGAVGSDRSSCSATYTSTLAAIHTITASYGGSAFHAQSSGRTTVTVTPGPPASVLLDPPAAENQVDTEHCLTATVRDRFGNPTPGITVRFSVTGSNLKAGMDTTDANGQAHFCYIGLLFGPDTITAFADTDNDGMQDLGEPTSAALKLWTLPASTPLCVVEFPTEGGHFTADNGDQASFGGNAHVSEAGEPQGEQTYQDHGPVQPMTVKSSNVLAVVCIATAGGKQATMFGEATIDGSGSYRFRIQVEDLSQDGSADTYWILLTNGYSSGRHTLEGGNVTIH